VSKIFATEYTRLNFYAAGSNREERKREREKEKEKEKEKERERDVVLFGNFIWLTCMCSSM
jgi:hypothetical protein